VECGVCGCDAEGLVPLGSNPHDNCARVLAIEKRLGSQEERMVEWRGRQASAIGGLLDRVVELEKRSGSGCSENIDREVRARVVRWVEMRSGEEIESCLAMLRLMGLGKESEEKGGDEE